MASFNAVCYVLNAFCITRKGRDSWGLNTWELFYIVSVLPEFQLTGFVGVLNSVTSYNRTWKWEQRINSEEQGKWNGGWREFGRKNIKLNL